MEFDVPEINVGIVQDYGEKDLTGSSYEWWLHPANEPFYI
jgi:hypothetical protein